MKLVIFDVDGTIVDSQHMIVAAMSRAFVAHGLAVPARDEILSIVGLSLVEAVGRLVNDHPDVPVAEVAAAYKEAFFALRADGATAEPLYDGALATIAALRQRDDVVLALATGKSRRGVAHLIDRHGLAGVFASIQTADDHPSKPDPAMVRAACAETGIAPARAVMIGDTVFDITMGRTAGARTLGVAWGYHAVADLEAAGADLIIERYDRLVAAVDRLLPPSSGTAP